MTRIELDRTLRAPVEPVFAALSDHEGYTRFRGITKAALVREGKTERNGEGAVRRLAAGRIWFEEEITVFEPPTRMGYRIRASNLPLEHEGGLITLTQNGSTVNAGWESTFRMTLPLVSAPAGVLFARVLERSFARMLEDAERLALEARG